MLNKKIFEKVKSFVPIISAAKMEESTLLFKNRSTEKLIIARLEHDADLPLSPKIETRTAQRLERVEARLDAISAVCNQLLLRGCPEDRRRVS